MIEESFIVNDSYVLQCKKITSQFPKDRYFVISNVVLNEEQTN